MLNFILGAVFGGFVTLFFIALVFTNKNAECADCNYYKNRFFGMLDKIESIIKKFRNNEVTADNAISHIESELRM